MLHTSESDDERRLLVEESAQLDCVALRDGGVAAALAVLDGAAVVVPRVRRVARSWGTAGDARTADVLLANLRHEECEHVLSLLDEQQRRDRTKDRPSIGPVQGVVR